MSTIDKAITSALSTLREVMQKLSQGVKKAEFDQEYRGKFISPGVSVGRYIDELRISGSLDETETTMRMRKSNVTSVT